MWCVAAAAAAVGVAVALAAVGVPHAAYVLGHAATAVIALQHRHVAVACVVVWAWHVGGLEKTVCGHAMHTPGTHQAHAGQAHIMHMACTHHAHTGHAHTMLMAHIGAPQTPLQNKSHSGTKPLSLLETWEARPPRFP